MFNGKCIIGFTYQKNGDAWELRDSKFDGRLREIVSREISNMLYIVLPKAPANWRPWIHLGCLLKILGVVKLDGGALRETYGCEGGREIYSVSLEIAERLPSYREG